MSKSQTIDPELAGLAEKAGILCDWEDVHGTVHHVSEPVLQSLLHALGLDCSSSARIRASLHDLDADRAITDGDTVIAQAGSSPVLPGSGAQRWTLHLESGGVQSGVSHPDGFGNVSLDPVQEPGYHRLMLGGQTLTLAVAPQRCPGVRESGDGIRPWGMVAQVYSLQRSRRDTFPAWMHGAEFDTVSLLARQAADRGASALALSPVHAMFSADPDRYSPYSPSSRLFLNVCYADPVQVLGADMVQEALARESWSPDEPSGTDQTLDWPRVAAARLRLLRSVFAVFRTQGPDDLAERFQRFRQDGGISLQRHALYETLHGHFAPELGPAHGWQDWPVELRDPAGPAASCFAMEHDDEVAFHVFAQWLAYEGLRRAQTGARQAGMSCGLIADLAIGTDPGGSHAWSMQDDILKAVTVGAPPDIYQPGGQDWGLTAFSPRGLRRGAYGAFIATLRASLRAAGGVRIDHVAGMERLWLVPEGAQAADGAYLRYPRHELLSLITLEAVRHDAIVIGENLGTVSEALNASLKRRGILGTSVLWFERDEPDAGNAVPAFRPAPQWSRHAIAMATTHDLPTIHGWWQERDIYWKVLLERLSPDAEKRERHERSRQRVQLWDALQQTDCRLRDASDPPGQTPLCAVLSFVARTPVPLALFALEDLLGLVDQPNMPDGQARDGVTRHPNWVQQLPVPVDTLFRDAAFNCRVDAVRRARSAP